MCREVDFQTACGELIDQIAPRILDNRGRPFKPSSLERFLARHRRDGCPSRQAVRA